MTTDKTFKRRVRERMTKTGESYTTARSHLARRRDRAQPLAEAPPALAAAAEPPPEMPSAESSLREATGRGWAEWLAILDGWGARQQNHTAIARYLIDECGVPGWWAQTVTVGYERARGMRRKHQQADGFSVSASRTVAASAADLFAAIVEDGRRRGWLTDGAMSLRTAQPGRSARFDWADDATRLLVSFDPKGPQKTTVTIAHEKLPDAETAEAAKAAWRRRLGDLKSLMEA